MRRIFGFVAVLLATPLCALAALPTGWPNPAKAPTATDSAAIANNGWVNSRETLAAALAKNYHSGSTGNTTFRSWLLLWQWCDLLARDEKAEAQRFLGPRLLPGPRNENGIYLISVMPPGYQPPASYKTTSPELILQSLNGADFLPLLHRLIPANVPNPTTQPLAELLPVDAKHAWTADTSFLQMFFDALSPKDYTPQVLRNLATMQQAQPKKFREYAALAIALAVVYDQNFPTAWPHHQVAPNLVPKRNERVADRFAFWIKSNESDVLLTDLRQLPPEQLKFVVDAPLDDSELLWAQNNTPHARPEFARTFGDIAYDTHRLVNNVVNWDKGPYTLENILRYGGICVDQAYFAFVCGKAVGLPTLFFDGQTKDGGHAWFGYLKAPDQWAMDCGRYASMGILTGKAFDPQTWDYITDHELAYLADAFHQQPSYTASRADLVMADVFSSLGDKVHQAKALDNAITACPRHSEAWDAKADFLRNTGASYPASRTHYEAAIRQFSNDPDLKVAWQTALMELANESGDHATVNTLQRQIVSQNEFDRTDLALNAEAEKIGAMINNHDLTGAMREFQLQAVSLGRNAGGNLYYRIVEPLATALYYSGDQPGAKKTVQTARDILKPAVNEILDVDMAKLEKTISAPLSATSTRR